MVVVRGKGNKKLISKRWTANKNAPYRLKTKIKGQVKRFHFYTKIKQKVPKRSKCMLGESSNATEHITFHSILLEMFFEI